MLTAITTLASLKGDDFSVQRLRNKSSLIVIYTHLGILTFGPSACAAYFLGF